MGVHHSQWRRPLVVVRARDVGDVMATVDFARENGLTLSVRGGGHSVPGFGTNDDGVVVDLCLMRSIGRTTSDSSR
jgi:FAD/FMN-containing dehydrogenase